MIVSKAVNMANAMEIPVLGLIENYSYVQCGSCGEKISVFGESHVDEVAEKFGLPVLAKLPIDPGLAWTLDHEAAEDFQGDWLDGAADAIVEKYPVEE